MAVRLFVEGCGEDGGGTLSSHDRDNEATDYVGRASAGGGVAQPDALGIRDASVNNFARLRTGSWPANVHSQARGPR